MVLTFKPTIGIVLFVERGSEAGGKDNGAVERQSRLFGEYIFASTPQVALSILKNKLETMKREAAPNI